LQLEITIIYEKPLFGLFFLSDKNDSKGKIISINIKQPKTFAEQMLEYSKDFSFLPLEN
jgi:hypothetical protein